MASDFAQHACRTAANHLPDLAHGGEVDDQLMFAGHNAYRFAEDPFYSNGFIPTVKQLIDQLHTGD